MKKKIQLIELLSEDLLKSVKDHMKAIESKDFWAVCGDKNISKTALKRKITLLRQELLNLERMIDSE